MARTKQLDEIKEIVRVVCDMTAGGCIKEYDKATEQCHRENRKPEEVSLCAKATEALRKCMEGKEVLAKHLIAMDEGIKEDDERRRWVPDLEVKKQDAGFRWWTGMRRIEED